jgi:hypothetical protein
MSDLGAAMVKGTSPGDAVERAWRIGINLGGQVQITEIPDARGMQSLRPPSAARPN